MEANKEVFNRKRAYTFIVSSVKDWASQVSADSDGDLAEAIGVDASEITSLKQGTVDPSEKMVTGFKKLVGPMVTDNVIDWILINPFKK